jgi:hypothetical protein
MDQNTQDTFNRHEKKLDAIFASVEKTRKYFLIILWVTIAMVVLPVIGLMLVIPTFIEMYTSTLNGLM